MLRVKQVAERMGISAALVYVLVSKGKLTCFRIGLGRGSIRFSEEDVEAFEAYLNSSRIESQLIKPERPKLKHLRLN